MTGDDDDPLFKLIILCTLQVKILTYSFPAEVTFKLVSQGNNLEKK